MAGELRIADPGQNKALFYWEVREDDAESKKTGKPVFKKVAYVKIISPGNRNEVPVFRATEKYQQQYPKEWAAFISGKEIEEEGYPISEWSQATRTQAALLASERIHTVEALAEIPDVNLTKIGPGMLTLKHKAQVHLSNLAGEADLQKMAAENKKLETRIKELEKQLSELNAELDAANKALSKGK